MKQSNTISVTSKYLVFGYIVASPISKLQTFHNLSDNGFVYTVAAPFYIRSLGNFACMDPLWGHKPSLGVSVRVLRYYPLEAML